MPNNVLALGTTLSEDNYGVLIKVRLTPSGVDMLSFAIRHYTVQLTANTTTLTPASPFQLFSPDGQDRKTPVSHMPQNRDISFHSAANQTPCVANIGQDAKVNPAIRLHQDQHQDGTKTGRGTVRARRRMRAYLVLHDKRDRGTELECEGGVGYDERAAMQGTQFLTRLRGVPADTSSSTM